MVEVNGAVIPGCNRKQNRGNIWKDMADLVEVLKTALGLGVEDRAALAEELLASLEELSPEEADHLWAEEAERRLKALRSGNARAIPAQEVHEKSERLLR